MKTVAEYRRADGSYDTEQIRVDAFNGNFEQLCAFLEKYTNARTWGTAEPMLPEPYEAIYREAEKLQLDVWNEEARKAGKPLQEIPELNRDRLNREPYRRYPPLRQHPF